MVRILPAKTACKNRAIKIPTPWTDGQLGRGVLCPFKDEGKLQLRGYENRL